MGHSFEIINKGRKGTPPRSISYGDDVAEEVGAITKGNNIHANDGCFVAGTRVLMADGTQKPIEKVSVGDLVLSRHEKTGEVAAKSVRRTFIHHDKSTLVLQLGNELIETTREHPFYVEGKGFVPAGQLLLCNSIVTRAGPAVALSTIERTGTRKTVYNLEVEDFHTYFVGNSALWVHNLCIGLPADLQKLHKDRKVWHMPKVEGSPATDLDDISVLGDEVWIIQDKLNVIGNADTVAKSLRKSLRKQKEAMEAALEGRLDGWPAEIDLTGKTLKGTGAKIRFGARIKHPNADEAFREKIRRELDQWIANNGISVNLEWVP